MSLFYINSNYKSKDRFDLAKFLKEENDTHSMLDSKFILDLNKLPSDGTFLVQTEEQRPDRIADKIYGDSHYWWVILMYNGITDVSEVVSGITINYPSLEDLEDLYFSLKSQESN